MHRAAPLLALVSRFGLAGLVNTGLGFAVIAGLDVGLHLDPHLANAAGYAVGVLTSFALNRWFVFRSSGHLHSTAPRYLAAVAAAFVANQAVLSSATAVLGHGAPQRLAAQLAGMVTYTGLVFVLCRLWVFQSFSKAASRSAAAHLGSNT